MTARSQSEAPLHPIVFNGDSNTCAAHFLLKPMGLKAAILYSPSREIQVPFNTLIFTSEETRLGSRCKTCGTWPIPCPASVGCARARACVCEVTGRRKPHRLGAKYWQISHFRNCNYTNDWRVSFFSRGKGSYSLGFQSNDGILPCLPLSWSGARWGRGRETSKPYYRNNPGYEIK